MSYTVLARKYRSPTFDDVVGQKAVITTLKNAIGSGRVHHGYLFCGTRGVGKTSMARILAKSLNCLAGDKPTAKPCGKCDSCVGVSSGEDIDVIEIDGASNNSVENIRELRGNAVLMPARARFKIYIIDEVHMLSGGAFNALLKTLEEPPAHVKFILATTDPQKVPATIQSRCQRFEFKPVPADEIAARLAYICKSEKIEADAAALKRVARLANGSIRDGVSLLDQLISMCGEKLTSALADELLPAAHDEQLAALIDKLAEQDAAGALGVADAQLGQGQSADQFCAGLVGQLRDLMVLRVCGDETDMVDAPASLRGKMVEQSKRFEPAAYVFMISMLEELRRSVRYSGSGRALIEAALVRLADTSRFASIESLLAKLDGAAAPTSTSAPRAGQSNNERAGPPPAPVLPRSSPAIEPPKKKEPVIDRPVPAASSRAVGRPRSEDMSAALNEPVVREAMEIFEGQLVNVQRGG